MFPEKYRKGDKAICRSVDFIRKTEGLADAGPICENCKYSKWEEGEKVKERFKAIPVDPADLTK